MQLARTTVHLQVCATLDVLRLRRFDTLRVIDAAGGEADDVAEGLKGQGLGREGRVGGGGKGGGPGVSSLQRAAGRMALKARAGGWGFGGGVSASSRQQAMRWLTSWKARNTGG